MDGTDKLETNTPEESGRWVLTRRDFLRFSGAALTGVATGALFDPTGSFASNRQILFGMVTDPHYADTPPRGTRFYRQSAQKMAECVALMNKKGVHFLIELGDFKDMDVPPNSAKTLEYLRKIEGVFQKFRGPTYHVLGNHDVDSISKDEFLRAVTNTRIPPHARFYAFSRNGIRFLVLDADFRKDGKEYCRGDFDWKDTAIPAEELAWLKRELNATRQPAIVFVHQPLDGEGDLFVKNAAAVRAVLENSKRVLAVFQGHKHEGGYSQINGIHYYTLKALVEGSGKENNAYATVEVKRNGDIVVRGYRKAVSRRWESEN